MTPIYRHKSATESDPRGETWELKGQMLAQVTVCCRKKGSSSCHVHKGEDKAKDPEQLFIAQGKIVFTLYVPDGSGDHHIVLKAGDEICIPKDVVHKIDILEDAIILELRTTEFDPADSDTYPAEIPQA